MIQYFKFNEEKLSIYSKFSGDSEASASEFLEHFKEMFSRHYIHATTQLCR